tara:strand:+ start:3652 stop:3837 length:186 start_codon:yes stop_codon:yes gene_type:complete
MIKRVIKKYKNQVIDCLFNEKFKQKIIEDLIERVDLPAFKEDTERQIYVDLIDTFEKRLRK